MLCDYVRMEIFVDFSERDDDFRMEFRQSRSTMATQDIGETINATNVIEGISPHWNEMIYADIPDELNHTEGRDQ